MLFDIWTIGSVPTFREVGSNINNSSANEVNEYGDTDLHKPLIA